MGRPFFAYILQCSDHSYYAGSSDDLQKRVGEHETGVGCTYTSRRLPVRLVWSQEFSTRVEAKAAEAQIKGWSRAKKEALIRGDFGTLQLLARKNDWSGHHERNRSRTGDSEDCSAGGGDQRPR